MQDPGGQHGSDDAGFADLHGAVDPEGGDIHIKGGHMVVGSCAVRDVVWVLPFRIEVNLLAHRQIKGNGAVDSQAHKQHFGHDRNPA